MKRLALLALLLGGALFSQAANYTIYVSDQTGWSTFNLYAWGDSEAFGAWPGATSAQTVSINNIRFQTYSYYANDKAATIELNLIFHNNVGENQAGDRRQLFTLTEPRDYYLQVTDVAISELNPSAQPETPVETETTHLNVDNTTPLSADNRVIYELNLYDFTAAGTLAAAQARLPQLRTLGIDIIWLMPIYPRGVQGKIGTLGSPYAPRDFTAVNPDHGSIQDLCNFVNTAHNLGMSVWLDWVPNHTGLDHVWVSTHPEYYVRINGTIQHPNDYGDVYQLDYTSQALRNEMTNAMLFWVNQADIDGFRCDYVSSPHIPVSYWQEAIPALQNNTRAKRVEMLGEADFTDKTRLYQAGFDYDYAWGFADGIKSVGNGTSITNARNAAQTMLYALNNNYADMSRMTYLTNHDDIGNNFSDNYMTVLGPNVLPMTVMYFTFAGMPLIYNGQEIGQPAILNYFNRNTINWNISNPAIRNTIRTLIALKHTQPALADGPATRRANTRMLTTNNASVLVYEKSKNGNSLIVVISLSDQPVNVNLAGVTPGQYNCVLNSQTISNGTTTTSVALSASPAIALEPKGFRIYTNSPEQQQTHHLYVDNQTGWSTFDLYEWGTPNLIFGAWPGATHADTEQRYNITWRDYPYSVSEQAAEVELNLIFHNNVGENKAGDRRQLITLTEPRDYYLTVTDQQVTEYNPPTSTVETQADGFHSSTAKLLVGRQLVIIHNNKVYNTLGNAIKYGD